MKPFYKFARGVVYPIFKWLLCVKFIGFDKIDKKGGYIVCANHTSMSDPFFLVVGFKRQLNFMAKAELFKIPVISQVLSAAGVFAVERSKGDISAIKKAEQLISDGHILGIFPEGTRYKTGAPRKAKSGIAYIAMHTKSDILPVSIYREGKFNIFKKTTVRCGEIIRYEDMVDLNDTDRSNLKRIANRVTDEITKLWEMKH